MEIRNVVTFFILSQFCIVSVAIDHSQPNPVLTQVSRQCIKIWCLIRNLVENDAESVEAPAESDIINHLDILLCRVMKVRDILSHYDTNPVSDTQTADYIDSSLDCIGQYTYDLKERYPGSWSTIIQEQVARTQEAYANYVLPLVTK